MTVAWAVLLTRACSSPGDIGFLEFLQDSGRSNG